MNVYKKIIGALIIFMLVAVVFYVLFLPTGQSFDQWTITRPNSQIRESIDMPHYENILEPGLYIYESTFIDANNFDAISIPRIFGYGFHVLINDQLIYEVGDVYNKPTANVWNHSFLIPINEKLIKDHNQIKILTYGYHDIGFNTEPTLVSSRNTVWLTEVRNLVTSSMGSSTIGATLIIGIMLFMLGFSRGKDKSYRYIGLACLLYSFYTFEYTFRLFTCPEAYFLLFRKLLLSAAYLSAIMEFEGVLIYYHKKSIDIKWRLLYLTLTLIIFIPTSFIALRILTLVFNFFLLIIMCTIGYVMFTYKKRSIVGISAFMLFTVIYSLALYTLFLPFVTFINYGIVVFLVGLAINLVVDYKQLSDDNTFLHIKATTDSLTGAFNRGYLEQLETHPDAYLVFLDIDHFKQYNDTYGHNSGDDLLADLVRFITKTLSIKGDVIRYGGDEFILIIRHASKKSCLKLVDTIRSYIVKKYTLIDISYGITRLKKDIHDTIQEADIKMYDMKDKHKRKSLRLRS